MAITKCVYLRKGGELLLHVFNFFNRLISKDSNGTANRRFDKALLRYGLLIKK